MSSAARSAPFWNRCDLGGRSTRRSGEGRAAQNGIERRRHRFRAVCAANQLATEVGVVDARRGVELIERKWRDEAGFTGAQTSAHVCRRDPSQLVA